MMDINSLMKQAQAVQQKFSEAQNKMSATVVTGTSGAGLVSLDLKGAGELLSLKIDPSLLSEDPEILSDLIVAAHADARKKLDEVNANLMKDAAGPFGGMGAFPGMPKIF
ncbi:YbaB/EbfC family nucleoid-associated protein [Asticcacaulis machinosus]|uniref:Nucleoid-associated protein PQU98_13460 n=1 Tax=Asticcacaulis machinosus TaxID=2984211 RepID=A0ABT5HLM1_9CAUL|nr:YbaB/EbfC family nucleoid-associated protein [Asticcacaulis machinosus]MDC7677146.1 YbaB/EbfC family nucleoid-associated protein [Asticcacaulis machinosus]